MLELETRPFEARFGTHCPFCGRSWGDSRPCGDSRADWTIRDGLRLLFSDRTDNCVVCDRQVQQGRKYCTDCGLSVQRAKNKEDRHARITGWCANPKCGQSFETRSDRKSQRYCSLGCAARKRFCKRGHDTDVVGRKAKGECRECSRISQRKAA